MESGFWNQATCSVELCRSSYSVGVSIQAHEKFERFAGERTGTRARSLIREPLLGTSRRPIRERLIEDYVYQVKSQVVV
jgi:hypothetical protein